MKNIIILFFMVINFKCFANDYVLVLSGGDNPGLNNYSQYLQTSTIYNYLRHVYGNNNTTIYFGMGNTPLGKNQFTDVHQIKNKVDVMLSGIIENNHIATKNNIYKYFFSQQLANANKNDILRLFISDHGLPDLFMEKGKDKYSNNCIDLWNFDNKLINNFDNPENFKKICLSKNELGLLLDKIQFKYVVFEMSQCYSGGFHQMSVTLENGYPHANTRICGFTASLPDHYASGCTADANGPSYQGYERYFTELYTGISIPTGKTIHKPALSMLNAHENAILEDKTVDIPISTSDYYLLQWADLFVNKEFKSRLIKYSTKDIQEIFNNYEKYDNLHNLDLKQFEKIAMQDKSIILAKYPKDKEFFNLNMNKQYLYIIKLESIISQKQNIIDKKNDLIMNLITNIIYPDWRIDIENHTIPGLSEKQYLMEKKFYFSIMDNKQFHMPYQLEPLFLQYLALNKNDPEIYNYQNNHFKIIEKWADNKKLYSVANAVRYDMDLENQLSIAYDEINSMEKEKQLLKRVYTYRQIIAAWVTLLKINDKEALNDLSGLLKCQHT